MKKILCFLSIFVSFLFINSVNAEELQIEVSKDDIEPGTYIIGEHMFTREKNEDYDGTLYVEYMLVASKTINSTSVDNMKVYYNSPKYGWINPMNNEVINEEDMPNTFNIAYKNSQLISGLQYGDVNGDGNVDSKDAVLIAQYLESWNVKIIEAAADLNLDGLVTELDAEILSRHLAKWNEYQILPINNLTDIVMYGDLDGDFEVTIEDAKKLEKFLYQTVDFTAFELLQADVNLDKVVDKKDFIVLLRFIHEVYKELPYTEVVEEVLFGDVNGDGKVDVVKGGTSCSKTENYNRDDCVLAHYLADWEITIDEVAADVNLDGVVDVKDSVALAQYAAGWALSLPFVSYEAEIHYGDVNNDGNIDSIDSVILTQYLAGWDVEIYLQAADVNNDSKINIKDKTILLRHLAGWEGYQDLPYKKTVNEFIYGDLDQDGKITSADATLLAQYLEDWDVEINLDAADLNLDNVVDDKDATILSQYLAAWNVQLPYVPE